MTNSPGQRKLLGAFLVSLSLVSGTAAGILWHSFRSGEVVRPIERKLEFQLLIEDKDCDSGISRDWFDGAHLVNESGEKIQSLTNIFLDIECDKDSDILRVRFVVEPTKSPIYRLVLFTSADKSDDRVLKLTEVLSGNILGANAELGAIASADCSSEERLCD